MTKKEEIIIFRSKEKLLSLSMTCLFFISIGIWLTVYKPNMENPFFDNVFLKYIIIGVSFFVFGAFIIYPIFKLFDINPALIIDKNGVNDYSNTVAVGQILWGDITEIKETIFFTQKFITIVLKNPKDYIEKQSSTLKRKTLFANLKKNGSPINISTNFLSVSHDELFKILTERLKEIKLRSEN